MKPHALIVSNKFPLPSDDGKKAVLAGFALHLIDRFGSDGVTYVVVGRPVGTPPPLGCRTVWIAPPGKLSQVGNALLSLMGLSRYSLQEAMTRSARVERALAALVQETAPVLMVLDTIRIGQYFESPASTTARRVLYMDDLFHLRFRKMLALASEGGGTQFAPVGTFGPMLPKAVRSALQFAPLRNLLYRLEVVKVKRRELAAPALFDRCLLINPIEAELLNRESGLGKTLAVKPLLFSCPPPMARHYAGGPVFVLFGSLRHPLYRASVVRFLQAACDEVIRAMPDVRIQIVGDGADEEIETLCKRRAPHVELCGFVDDIGPLLASACALLVPSIAGGGLRLKAVTAMHRGLPIVSTRAGIEGIPLEDGVSYLREDTIENFAGPMAKLRDQAINEEISRRASAVFDAHYSRASVFAEYDVLFGLP